MSIFSKKTAVTTPVAAVEPAGPVVGKGAPTPKQREKAPHRGPVPPPPKTQREAFKRAKTPSGAPMSKEEKKAAAASRRERMMRGDDSAVLARDRGPVRRYVRDVVDARRNISGLLLPVLIFSFVMSTLSPLLQVYGMILMLVVILASVADSVVLGRQISRRVRDKFPQGDPTGVSVKGSALGYYAFNRAMLPRRFRAPRSRLRPGDTVD
ncbi:MAG: DUF3043 domain-containing protein [Nakamurella sp.]